MCVSNDYPLLHFDLPLLHSNLLHMHSDLTFVHPDLTLMYSDFPTCHSDLSRVSSALVCFSSWKISIGCTPLFSAPQHVSLHVPHSFSVFRCPLCPYLWTELYYFYCSGIRSAHLWGLHCTPSQSSPRELDAAVSQSCWPFTLHHVVHNCQNVLNSRVP